MLETDPFNRIKGLYLYFIELDGSTGLVLSASTATVDAAAGTLTWSVADQPWQAGRPADAPHRSVTSVGLEILWIRDAGI